MLVSGHDATLPQASCQLYNSNIQAAALIGDADQRVLIWLGQLIGRYATFLTKYTPILQMLFSIRVNDW